MINFSYKNALNFLSEDEVAMLEDQIKLAHRTLEEKTGPGHDFLGWVDWSDNYDKEEFARILKASKKIQETSDVLICAGIGGSYLGAQAAIDALTHQFGLDLEEGKGTQVIFCGNQISPTYLKELMETLDDFEVSVNVISKSGTTTETAIAFRVLKQYIEERYGKEEAKERIYVTTDKSRGALKTLADREGYESFVVPDAIGGRYSVLTAVGLLPIAVAGIDIEEMMRGLKAGEEAFRNEDLAHNAAYQYAAVRTALYRKGYAIEVLVNYEPYCTTLTEWWKQLYGESEGKDHKGLFPAGVSNTTDLHSMGQYIQDGRRILFESVLWFKESKESFIIPEDEENLDGLNYLAGKDMHEVNFKAMQGTVLAHVDGGVPNLMIEVDKLDAFHFGALVYFFERACGISGYLNGINPFNQPGVEDYKTNMFALLGKPGYEEKKAELEKRLS
jgi:glucose-6-phosphate isomerase